MPTATATGTTPPQSSLRFGLVTPIVSLLPGTPEWEVNASPSDLKQIASAADRFGFRYLTCSEHVGIPTAVAAARGPRFYDPLATLSFLAAITERIRLLTHVVVLPYHHPLAIAKRYGTLDKLCGGRLTLGVGVGTLKEEFDLLGVDFEHRGERHEEALEALRIALGAEKPVFHGQYFNFDDFIIDPRAEQVRVPIWLGGRTPRSLRRALGFGEGWVPFGLSLDELRALLAKAREWPEWQGRAGKNQLPLEIALALDVPIDVAGNLNAFQDRVNQTLDAGATLVSLTVRAKSAAHYVEQLEALSHVER